MPSVHTFRVVPNLPERLMPLGVLVRNLWWTWNPEAVHLLRRMDPDEWEATRHNPVDLLGRLSQERLEALANNDAVISTMDRVVNELGIYLSRKTWFQKNYPERDDLLVAYFCAEFGLHESLPLYSGGLGILGGDHLKGASDLGIPLVGVGLLYRRGYFGQYLSRDGWQQELHRDYDFDRLPVQLEKINGRPCRITVEIAGRSVLAQIWRVHVGRVSLFLLDTDLPENDPIARQITDELYGGDRRHRIQQEILLGVGGHRALRALGHKPTVYHLNEGHSAFSAIERIREGMEERGMGFEEALEVVRANSVFTTHTPVPAGNDVFSEELIREHFESLAAHLGIPLERLMALGRVRSDNRSEPLCMTVLALNTTTQANGVSRLHGEVSRKMWADLYAGVPVEEIPIKFVKNGIHIPTWYSREVATLFSRYLGPGWQEDPKDREIWKRVDRVPDAELWRARCSLRERLVSFTRGRLQDQFRRRGLPHTIVRAAEEVLDPDALTICFARRFAVYKRANLLLSDPDRLDRLVNDPERPVQIVFAGKAHPADQPGKQVMREIIHLASETRFRHRIVFLEDYGIDVARVLVQGADVWLNTPRRPLEASGTSGMKAAVSGGLHLSVLDGWWDEAYTPETGWAIGNAESYDSPETQDQVESEALYDLLAQEVIPLFYKRGSDALPREWIARIKASMIAHCPVFNANRMVGEYARHYYIPAHERSEWIGRDNHSWARELAAWRQRTAAAWRDVTFVRLTFGEADLPVGQAMPVRAEVNLGSLSAEDVIVEAVHGEVESGDTLRRIESVPLRATAHSDGVAIYEGEIPCRTTGRRGLSVRIRPTPRLNPTNPFDANLLTWWEGGEANEARNV